MGYHCISIYTIWLFPKIVGFPPKSSILIGFSIINHAFWGYPYFWKHPYVSRNVLGESPPTSTNSPGTSRRSCWGLRVHRTNWPIGRENPRPRGTPRATQHIQGGCLFGCRKRWAWWHIIPQLAGKMPLLYTTYIYIYCLLGWLYATYHLLWEPETTIDHRCCCDNVSVLSMDGKESLRFYRIRHL